MMESLDRWFKIRRETSEEDGAVIPCVQFIKI